jgi:hypothetical protein
MGWMLVCSSNPYGNIRLHSNMDHMSEVGKNYFVCLFVNTTNRSHVFAVLCKEAWG